MQSLPYSIIGLGHGVRPGPATLASARWPSSVAPGAWPRTMWMAGTWRGRTSCARRRSKSGPSGRPGPRRPGRTGRGPLSSTNDGPRGGWCPPRGGHQRTEIMTDDDRRAPCNQTRNASPRTRSYRTRGRDTSHPRHCASGGGPVQVGGQCAQRQGPAISPDALQDTPRENGASPALKVVGALDPAMMRTPSPPTAGRGGLAHSPYVSS